MEAETIEIGTVRRAHGVRGWLRVQLHNPESEALRRIRRVLVGSAEGRRVFAVLQAHEVGEGVYLVQLDGVVDRDQAEVLKGQPVLAWRQDLPPLGPDEYYLSDLMGCQAVMPDGQPVGVVRAVVEIAGRSMLEVERAGRPPALIPLAAEFVTAVDLAARRVEIDPPEGLLDLDLGGRPRGPRRRSAGAPRR
ncbi:MAG: ribosome maturation factor RimM [Myxococcales bacterium]|nr:ribosome maturation factor RimM [Myxococcota bacterium]MDW8281665.1 ribosome maturation factor RimM [Myxococcales bacterium]